MDYKAKFLSTIIYKQNKYLGLRKGSIMEKGRFYIKTQNEKILNILSHIMNDEAKSIQQVCERYGNDVNDVRYYDVYTIETSIGSRILKLSSEREAFNYENYLTGKNFAVPFYYGKWIIDDRVWIMIENVLGSDLRDMTNELAILVADKLAAIQNYYWKQGEECSLLRKTNERYNAYLKRILKRADSIIEHSEIRTAYQLFINRQMNCPCTLSHGDFLEFNVLHSNDDIIIIDWGFGGMMPYSLDIARFIAHATETRSTFPFYMSKEQKSLFVNRVYNKLEQKPTYEQYLSDLKLSILNEYIEFVEANEDEDGWYYNHALQLAEEILNTEFNYVAP